jgi:endonuclease/exonuclease/phosphatase family metal-dependent hydrolase
MKSNLLTKRRMVLDQQVQEPTLLVLVLIVMGLIVALGVCVLAIAGLPAFGYIWWIFAAVAAILAWLVWGIRRKPKTSSPSGRLRWLRRILGLARLLFIIVLTCWLGLIVWSAFCTGGPDPLPKTEAALIRVVTWNLHCGQDNGPPWKQFNWPVRKHSLRAALDRLQPDILCVQEATPDQVTFIEEELPGHHRVGVGRNGDAGGEHCAIYFSRQRFEEIDGNTFWLEEPIDQPRAGSALDVKRICTWVRLRDRLSGRTLRVYNTHLYLTEAPRFTAAKLIIADIAAGDPADAVLLTADFNASPAVPSRRLFTEAGLADSAEKAGQRAGKPTFHFFYGIGIWCIDGILVDEHWRVHNHLILNVKPKHTFPSDHFGLLADLELPE